MAARGEIPAPCHDYPASTRAALRQDIISAALRAYKVVRGQSSRVQGASTLTLLAPPNSLPLRIARGYLRQLAFDYCPEI